jgi:nucleoside-diphosphate-sugar epimerase/putative sterol carrier protein
MKIVVTGGSGQLGTILLRRLAADRAVKSLVCLDLRPPAVASPKLQSARADVREAGIERHMEGADALVHLAFLVTQAVPREEMRSINVDGSKNVFRAALHARVPAVVYASSVAAYGVFKDHPRPIVEETPRRYQSSLMYAATKFEVEAHLDDLEAAHPDTAFTRLRPGILAGARMDHALGRALSARLVLDPGSPALPWVWDEDVAEAAILALKRRARGAFNVVADGELEPRAFAEAAGFRYLRLPARVLAGLTQLPRGLTGVPPGDPAWLDTAAAASMVISNERAKQELGWTPRCPTTADVARRLGEVMRGPMDARLSLFFRLAALAARRAPPMPEAASMTARVHLDITGPGGGDVGLIVDQGRLSVEVGSVPRPPTSVVSLRKALLLELLAGETSVATAQLTGRVRIEGEPLAGLLLGTMVAMFRKETEEPGAKGFGARKIAAWMAKGE